nr:hypothetical protein KXZ65_02310 [Pectobacterium sp. PL152]
MAVWLKKQYSLSLQRVCAAVSVGESACECGGCWLSWRDDVPWCGRVP